MNSCQLTNSVPGTSVLVQIMGHHVFHAGSFLIELFIHVIGHVVLDLPLGLVPALYSFLLHGASKAVLFP